MNEIWKDIEGYEGKYQVSNLGNVKSLNYKNSGKEQNIALCNDADGYLLVNLRLNNKVKTKRVHRLVAQAFIPNPENKPQVNHIDGNKKNNKIENLEWCTCEENQRHAWDKGLKIRTKEMNERQSKRMSGESNPNFGKVMSDETKLKISQSKIGKTSPNKGKKMTKEQREKISKAKKKKIMLINTMEIFDSIIDASHATGINKSTIRNGLKSKNKRGGTIKGEPALWSREL